MDYMEYKNSDNFSSHLLITAGSVDHTYAKLWFVNDAQFKIDNVRYVNFNYYINNRYC